MSKFNFFLQFQYKICRQLLSLLTLNLHFLGVIECFSEPNKSKPVFLGAIARFSKSEPLYFLVAIEHFSEFHKSEPLFLGAIAR